MKVSLCIFILLGIFSCRVKNNNIKVINSDGLNAENLGFSVLHFLNENDGFIAGSSDRIISSSEANSDTFATVERRALIYSTTDGGKTWIKTTLGKGKIDDMIAIGNTLFLFKSNTVGKHISTFASYDKGHTWIEKPSYPDRIFDLLSNGDSLYAIGMDTIRNSACIYRSNNQGLVWQKINFPNQLIYGKAILKDKKIYYLSTTSPGAFKKNLIVVCNLGGDMINAIELPKEFDCYFIGNYNNEIKLIGLMDAHITVARLQRNDRLIFEYQYPKEKNLIPKGYFANKAGDLLVVGKRHGTEITNKILQTNNNGKSWRVIPFSKENFIMPFCFLRDTFRIKAWFYSGSGMFQVLE